MRLPLAVLLALALAGNAYGQSADEPRYLEQTSRAMDKMMADMTIGSTGDVDADFVAAMVPHHTGAIAMAKAELQYGRNELLRRMAQEIIVDQLQEIEAMRLALNTGSAAPGTALSQEPRHEP